MTDLAKAARFYLIFGNAEKNNKSWKFKTRLFIVIFLCLISIIPLISQDLNDFPAITASDLPDVNLSEARKFAGSSLFGYIDGGAELYLEYGFVEAVITEIGINSRKFKCEIYKMNGTDEAFGIFSVSKYKCGSFPPVAEFSCQTKYQLQFCKGPFYISIIARSGTEADSIEMLAIGRIISDKISLPEIDLSVYFPETATELLKHNTFMAKGRLGIVNGDPDLEDFFDGAQGYTVFILKSPEKKEMSLVFSNMEDYTDFLKLHRWNQLILESGGPILDQNENIRQLSDKRLLVVLKE
jgi:hypothetical protein